MKNYPTKYLLVLIAVAWLVSCAPKTRILSTNNAPQRTDGQAFILTEISEDNTYGYSEKNPIKVGGVDKMEGPVNERRFLNALAGPNGEPITYQRMGSCCPFKTPNGFSGSGLLDKYKILWEGQTSEVFLYINMYDYAKLKCPVGLTIKSN